jgi:hypothetical protein
MQTHKKRVTLFLAALFSIAAVALTLRVAVQSGQANSASDQVYLPTVLISEPAEPTDACYVEINGSIIGEIEAAPLSDNWEYGQALSDYFGGGYYVWRNSFNTDPNNAVLHYGIEIENPGQYYLLLRTFNEHHDSTEDNDVWVQVDDSGWQKTYSRRNLTWTWDTCQVDHNCAQPQFYLTAGRHDFQVSPRSPNFNLDRFVLYTGGISWNDPPSPTCLP